MIKIPRNIDDVKAQAIDRLCRFAGRAQQKGDLVKAQRFHEGAAYLESGQKPSWARRPSGRGR